MQLRYKFELRCQLDRLRHSLDSAKILFWLGVGGWVGRLFPRIRLTSAKDLVEVEAELGNDYGCRNGKYVRNSCNDSPLKSYNCTMTLPLSLTNHLLLIIS